MSPDGCCLLAGYLDNRIELLDARTLEVIRVMEGHNSPARAIAFSPDGSMAVSGANDGVIMLWDLETGQAIRSFAGSRVTVDGIVVSPDGKLIFSSGHDGGILMWDIETGKMRRHYAVGYGLPVTNLAMSPDGQNLFAETGFGVMRIRIDTTGDLIEWMKENRYLRDLSCEERALYHVKPLCQSE